MAVYLKRVYDAVSPTDGKRILVDRLWPRGIAKEEATWVQWAKDASPSPQLRKWFAHQVDRFDLFRIRYEEELANDPVKQQIIKQLREDASNGILTLVYAAKNETCNHAIILREWLIDDHRVVEKKS
ncbi:MAG TPA: DUF488 family protein [Bacillota bacterium]|nr:DUF488 family protein [Bacillota bacterium]